MTRPDRSRRSNLTMLAAAAALSGATTEATIQRGEGNLVRIKKADKLSLVDLPANQTGFKVLRKDDTGGEPEATTAPTRVRRTRRSDSPSPVLGLTFPTGVTRAEVDKALASYGMSGYTISEEGGVFRAIRSDLKSIANDALEIKLNDAGVMASIQRNDALIPATEVKGEKAGLSLVELHFDASKFDETQVSEWLTRNAIDSKIAETQNSDTSIVVSRSEAPEGEETRQMELEDGVVAVLVRADANDLPDGFYVVINETAYGNWGWGQLDFAASLADKAFSEQVRSGLNLLDDVLRNILFYSPLPLDVRKTLVTEALTQFNAYVAAIMDSLPRQLLATVVRSAPETQPSQQENHMTQKTDGGATNTGATNTGTPASAAPQQEAALTRADVAAMVADGVTAGLKAAGLVKDPEPDPNAPITRSDLTKVLTGVLSEAMKPIEDRMAKVEGTTVLRSDVPDAATEKTEGAVKTEAEIEADKKSGVVFRGAFPGMIPRARAS